MRIVRTANDDRNYPVEEFLNLSPGQANYIADAINEVLSGSDPVLYPSFWKVVSDDYKLAEPFEL